MAVQFPFSGAPKKVNKVSVNFASLNAGAIANETVTVPGLRVGDIIVFDFPDWPAASTIGILRTRIKAANTFEITIRNVHATDAENMAAQYMYYYIL